MENILLKFSLTPAPLTKVTWIWLMLIWCLVLLAAIASIWNQGFSRTQRIFWIAVVVGLPVLGLLLYLLIVVFGERNGLLSRILSGIHGGKGD